MKRYSAEPRDRIFVKKYRFLSFAETISKNFCKKVRENTVKNV